MDKILYLDGEKHRLLKGKIISEDDLFIKLKLTQGFYRINKKNIISIRQGGSSEQEDNISSCS